jgi:energy-coupling factor transport system permease protein
MLQTGPVLLGQYRPIDSFLHHLDARAKLLPILLIFVLALFAVHVWFYIIVLALLIAGLLWSKVGAGNLMRSFRPIVLLVLITCLYHLIFSGRGSPVVFEILGWKITSLALANAAFFSLRLILFIAVAFLVTLTNSPSELAETVTKILKPLEKVRVPVNDIGLIVFIAIRFIPILYDEFVAIRNAQMIRGVTFSGSWVNRIRKTTYLLIPVFAAAINRADDLALAIESRGYRTGARRTCYSHTHFGAREWWFMVAASLGVAGLFFVAR